jgi:hypothetical protein
VRSKLTSTVNPEQNPTPGDAEPHPKRRGRTFRRSAIATAIGAAALVLAVPTTASANVLTALPQNADSLEQTYSPAYDFDTDGCYSTAAIGTDGTLNPGLPLGGAVNGNCHDMAQLNNDNTYSREKCNNDWCAVMYASYFEKDQDTDVLPIGHTHDWEHVVVWIYNNAVQYVAVSQHSGYLLQPASAVRFDGTHAKVVYQKDSAGSHDFRFANTNDEPAENATGNWFYPRLVGWNGYPAGLRDKLMSADFGTATLKIDDGDFQYALSATEPAGIPFDPNA